MSLGKYHSVTSDTKATRSFNQSLAGHPKINKQLQQSEHCEVQFLRRKNSQLQEKVARMTKHIEGLEANKVELMGTCVGI